ncbi:hypothetical protein MMC14_008129 [Varicellaria rhodocarpa]|nr:hypothetical protein [Varicellaria rhodocarpa]
MEGEADKKSHITPNLVLNEPRSSIVPHALLFIIQILALALPSFRGRRSLISMLIIGLAIRALLGPHFTNNVGLAQLFTISWSYHMATLAKLAFSGEDGSEARFWRIDRPQKEAMRFAAFGWAKLKWALKMITNQRGIRWNFEVKNVPPVTSLIILCGLLANLTIHRLFTVHAITQNKTRSMTSNKI